MRRDIEVDAAVRRCAMPRYDAHARVIAFLRDALSACHFTPIDFTVAGRRHIIRRRHAITLICHTLSRRLHYAAAFNGG